MNGIKSSSKGVAGPNASQDPWLGEDSPRSEGSNNPLCSADLTDRRPSRPRSRGRHFLVLDVGKWSFERIHRELHELACQGWQLIAGAGYGKCGVRIWLAPTDNYRAYGPDRQPHERRRKHDCG